MVELSRWADIAPHKIALNFPDDGVTLTFRELHRRADRVARWFVGLGLQAGDSVAYLLDNSPLIFELAFGARRAGLYYTPLNTHLRAHEIAYVLRDSGAKVLVAGSAYLELARAITSELGSAVRTFVSGRDGEYEAAVSACEDGPAPAARPVGRDFVYSSGTTGFPKGIRKPLTPHAQRFDEDRELTTWKTSFSFGEDTIYLSPAPLYHASPIRYCMRTVQVGGACVVMRKFDAEAALRYMDAYSVTHSQWVPIMFVRMLALPADVRGSYKLSTMRYAIHAAAPCPPLVKDAMLDWWGDRIWEFYGGSEGIGLTMISGSEWRARRGSVGRAVLGEVHITGEDGEEVPVGDVGKVYFSGGPKFAYHNDPIKTASAFNARGWATYGDIGHVDLEGYLYLSGRRIDLIISGGVNIYPQEIEDCLAAHPDVHDVAVVGVPNPEFGEEVKAVVQLRNPASESTELARELIAFCRDRLPGFKTPRSIEFDANLPRLDNGKLMKRQIKERYWTAPGAAVSETVR